MKSCYNVPHRLLPVDALEEDLDPAGFEVADEGLGDPLVDLPSMDNIPSKPAEGVRLGVDLPDLKQR